MLSLWCSSLATCLCSSFHPGHGAIRCTSVHTAWFVCCSFGAGPVRSHRQGEHLVPDDLQPEARRVGHNRALEALYLWLLKPGGRVREIPEPPGLQRIFGSLVGTDLPMDGTRLLGSLCFAEEVPWWPPSYPVVCSRRKFSKWCSRDSAAPFGVIITARCLRS